MSGDWKNEDDIKAELRVLTAELRNLRYELRNMVTPHKSQHPARDFLKRQSWPGVPAAEANADEKPRDTPPSRNTPPKPKKKT